ncbi:MAG: protein translocase subunit SecF [Candidatus Nealsonbacteria bacterium CG_4_10_14_0_2_um_filter_38_17]|uniref:Protein-export membrane protein SecF n=2 Tax=Candidatus Nealsoniibacteriota TaxID=1817911 RepID=A0A2M7UY45_9BACT|nr:MAG: protein translocase subunit SecF [Candidatus Nealsonbacteria bacterium CG23_combo_of_CG06-09_8_20_14_all_38_19]PIZ88785.1 MAG: protein translocase subunit SecF [Candidatus Nealsonbacteria bacterium CG_4_10_14_0_2_um_filter_38_17]
MFFDFLKYTKVYYFLFGLLVIASLVSLFSFGLNFGIDFTGGSILEIDFLEQRPSNQEIQAKLSEFNLGEFVIQPTGEKGVIIRMREVDEETHQQIIAKIGELAKLEEKKFENIGPTVGRELRQKTIQLIVISSIVLLVYIAMAFRKISWPVSGWQCGVVSIVALSFDVLATIGIFSLLGKYSNVQFNIPIVAALLTILGYTINDKVIVLDRVRENILKTHEMNFYNLVNQSLNQILVRSLSTGTCSLLILLAIFFFGGETLKYFSLALIIGIIIGTFSSLFLASPLLVSWKGGKTSSRA